MSTGSWGWNGPKGDCPAGRSPGCQRCLGRSHQGRRRLHRPVRPRPGPARDDSRHGPGPHGPCPGPAGPGNQRNRSQGGRRRGDGHGPVRQRKPDPLLPATPGVLPGLPGRGVNPVNIECIWPWLGPWPKSFRPTRSLPPTSFPGRWTGRLPRSLHGPWPPPPSRPAWPPSGPKRWPPDKVYERTERYIDEGEGPVCPRRPRLRPAEH